MTPAQKQTAVKFLKAALFNTVFGAVTSIPLFLHSCALEDRLSAVETKQQFGDHDMKYLCDNAYSTFDGFMSVCYWMEKQRGY